mmetsp:Transcript_18902/g.31640  ORF Transcript_18902/g.31640 Transcript_18902/m.31640 type:complete len:249 (+) Transcript_18902:401-1147(+)
MGSLKGDAICTSAFFPNAKTSFFIADCTLRDGCAATSAEPEGALRSFGTERKPRSRSGVGTRSLLLGVRFSERRCGVCDLLAGAAPAECGVLPLPTSCGESCCSTREGGAWFTSCLMSYSISAASCRSRDRISCRCCLWSLRSSRKKRKTSRKRDECCFSRKRLSSITIGTIASTVALRATIESTLPLAAAAADCSSSASSCATLALILTSSQASSRNASESTKWAFSSVSCPSETAASTSWHNLAIT